MTESINTIHEVVQERYGAIARGESASCCGPDADCGCASPALYDVSLIETLPSEVVNLSLG